MSESLGNKEIDFHNWDDVLIFVVSVNFFSADLALDHHNITAWNFKGVSREGMLTESSGSIESLGFL